MAAEKLTTARLVQILVVMSVLIGAFIWRTYDHAQAPNTLECKMIAESCSVSVDEETVEIHVKFQQDKPGELVVNTIFSPSEVLLKNPQGSVIFPNKIADSKTKKRAYFYALPSDVKYGTDQFFVLVIDQDQVEIKF